MIRDGMVWVIYGVPFGVYRSGMFRPIICHNAEIQQTAACEAGREDEEISLRVGV